MATKKATKKQTSETQWRRHESSDRCFVGRQVTERRQEKRTTTTTTTTTTTKRKPRRHSSATGDAIDGRPRAIDMQMRPASIETSASTSSSRPVIKRKSPRMAKKKKPRHWPVPTATVSNPFPTRFQPVSDRLQLWISTNGNTVVRWFQVARYPVIQSFTGFSLVLPGFTGFYEVLLGFTGFYLVLPCFTGFLPGFT